MRHPSTNYGIAGKTLSVIIVAALAAFTAAEASAQMGGSAHAGNDVVSLNLYGGGYFSGSTFSDGTEFDDTGALGANATVWAHRNLGIRGNVLWFQPDVIGTSQAQLLNQNPDVIHYSGDVVLRMPMAARENLSWYPYILGGVGGKSYDFEPLDEESPLERETDFAGNVGVGLEVRFGETGRWGIHTEVRDFISEFDRAQLNETLHDVIWTGGLSFNF